MKDKKRILLPVGFTLIELLVVIVIIAILVSFTSLWVIDGIVRARDSQRKSDLKQIQTALQLYFQDTGNYPDPDPSSHSCNSSSDCWKTLLSNSYIKSMPVDPLNDNTHLYYYCRDTTDSTKYTLVANLENSQDHDPKTANNCSNSVGYVKTNP